MTTSAVALSQWLLLFFSDRLFRETVLNVFFLFFFFFWFVFTEKDDGIKMSVQTKNYMVTILIILSWFADHAELPESAPDDFHLTRKMIHFC